MLAIKTTGGNKAIQAAITGSGNAPPSTLTYSCGVLLVGVEVNGFNPVEEIFQDLLNDTISTQCIENNPLKNINYVLKQQTVRYLCI